MECRRPGCRFAAAFGRRLAEAAPRLAEAERGMAEAEPAQPASAPGAAMMTPVPGTPMVVARA